MNSVFDCGLVGSWFWSCTTSSFRNASLPIPISLIDAGLDAAEVGEVNDDGIDSTAILCLSVHPAANELLHRKFVEPLPLIALYRRHVAAPRAFT